MLVTPVPDLAQLEAALQFVEHEMLPQQSYVFPPKLVPSAVVADKPRIERVHLGGRDDFGRTMRAERTDDMRDQGGLQYFEIVPDGSVSDLAFLGEFLRLEDSSAPGHQQFSKPLERIPAFQSEELLDVFGPEACPLYSGYSLG